MVKKTNKIEDRKEEETKTEKKVKVDDGGIVKPSSTKKAEFKKLIETYKIKNPVKYERKKAYLEKQLASL